MAACHHSRLQHIAIEIPAESAVHKLDVRLQTIPYHGVSRVYRVADHIRAVFVAQCVVLIRLHIRDMDGFAAQIRIRREGILHLHPERVIVRHLRLGFRRCGLAGIGCAVLLPVLFPLRDGTAVAAGEQKKAGKQKRDRFFRRKRHVSVSFSRSHRSVSLFSPLRRLLKPKMHCPMPPAALSPHPPPPAPQSGTCRPHPQGANGSIPKRRKPRSRFSARYRRRWGMGVKNNISIIPYPAPFDNDRN